MTKTHHSIPIRKLDLELIDKNEMTCHIVEFAVTADYRIKTKESERIDEYMYLDLEYWEES